MGFLSFWRKVYVSNDYNDFTESQNILKENNIDYKVNVKSDALRVSLNNLGGSAGVVMSRGGTDLNNFYSISVRKKDEEQAKKLLGVWL